MFRQIALAAALTIAAASPAWGQAAIDVVRSAKETCAIGEQIDGFLGVVDESAATDAIRDAMDEINLRRRARYAELAREQGVSLDVVARLAGERVVELAAESGHCFLDDSGAWSGG